MSKILWLILVILFFSCKKEEKKYSVEPIEIERVFVMRFSSVYFEGNEKTEYRHFLLIKNYSDRMFRDNNFIKIANEYVDTCVVNKSKISSVYFLRSINDCGFEYNEPNYKIINRNTLVAFTIEGESVSGLKVFSGGVEKVYGFENGKIVEK